jgi:hypothetical protein
MHTGGTTNTFIIHTHGRSADVFIRNRIDKEFAVSEINKFSASPSARDVKNARTSVEVSTFQRTRHVFGSDVTPLWPYGGRLGSSVLVVKVHAIQCTMLGRIEEPVGLSMSHMQLKF